MLAISEKSLKEALFGLSELVELVGPHLSKDSKDTIKEVIEDLEPQHSLAKKEASYAGGFAGVCQAAVDFLKEHDYFITDKETEALRTNLIVIFEKFEKLADGAYKRSLYEPVNTLSFIPPEDNNRSSNNCTIS